MKEFSKENSRKIMDAGLAGGTEVITTSSNNARAVDMLKSMNFSKMGEHVQSDVKMMMQNIEIYGGEIPPKVFANFSDAIFDKMKTNEKIAEYFRDMEYEANPDGKFIKVLKISFES